nr:hypothetical protein [Tanacetum cinerariifolium]
MFDEYFVPLPNVNHPVPKVHASVLASSTSSPSSTTVDQDAPLKSTSQTTSEQKSSVIPQGVEDDFRNIEVAHMDNDSYFGIQIPEPSSKETTLQGVIPSNLHHINQSFDILTMLTKYHPLENVSGDPSRSISTRSQLQEHAIWCYFDANDNPIPFGVVDTNIDGLDQSKKNQRFVHKQEMSECLGMLRVNFKRGGPGIGRVGVKKHLAPYLPSHPVKAMLDEYNALITNGTWVLVPRHVNVNIMCSM